MLGSIDLNNKPRPTSDFSMAADVKCHSATPKLIGSELPYLTLLYLQKSDQTALCLSHLDKCDKKNKGSQPRPLLPGNLGHLGDDSINFKVMFFNAQHRNEKKASKSTRVASLYLKLLLLGHLNYDADHQKRQTER